MADTAKNDDDSIELSEIQASIPTMVQSVDLEILSQVLNCTTEEVIEGLHTRNNAVNVAGKVLAPGAIEPALFESVLPSVPEHRRHEEEQIPAGSRRNLMQRARQSNRSVNGAGGSDRSLTLGGASQRLLAIPPKTHMEIPSLVMMIPSKADYAEGEEIQVVLQNDDSVRDEDLFEGFLVDVGHVGSDASSSEMLEEHARLLEEDDTFSIDEHGHFSTSYMHNSMMMQNSVMLSLPLKAVQGADETPKAYLISMPVGANPNDPESPSKNTATALAVPGLQMLKDDDDDDTFPALTRAFSQLPGYSMMERALSILPTDHLPTDVERVTLETVGHKNEEVVAVVERRVPVIGYVLLVMSLLAGSSYGPTMQLEVGVKSALIKLYWRFVSGALVMIPLALKGLWWRKDAPKMGQTFTAKDCLELLATSFCFVVSGSGYILALNYADVGTVALFAGTHSIILVLAKVVMGMYVPLLEGSGAAVGIIGGMLTTLDGNGGDGDSLSHASNPTLGKCLAFASAGGYAGYLLLACRLRPKMDLFVFMCLNFIICSFWCLGLMTFLGVPYELSTDPSTGLFGWMELDADRLLLEMWIVFVCTIMGSAGFVAVMKYFEALVLSVILLLQPVIVVILGLLLGVGSVPGKWMCMGGVLVSVGCFMVVSSASKKTEAIDVKEAVTKLDTTGDACTKSYGSFEMGKNK